MIPTSQQQMIYDLLSGGHKFMETESGNISVNAVAGSGKTTTAVNAIPYASKRFKRIGFMAFGNEIANTLKGRINGQAYAGTMHSFGVGLVRQRYGQIPLEKFKYLDILKRECKGWYDHSGKFPKMRPEFDAAFALMRIIREQNFPIQTVTEKLIREIANLAGQNGVSLPTKDYLPELIGGVFRALEIGSDNPKCVDFADMVWLPVRLGLVGHQFDLMFADEAQDFNPIQQQFILNIAPTKVIIGDPAQSIMGFAGADTRSFQHLTEWMDARKQPLSVCWRCPSSHLNLARNLVEHIQDAPNAKEGHLGRVGREYLVSHSKGQDMILCRANAPLVSLAYEMLRNGKPCIVRGKNIGDGIVAQIKKLNAYNISDLNIKLQHYKVKEVAKLVDRDASQESFDTLYDQVDCIQTMAGAYDTVDDLLDACGDLFRDSDGTRSDQVVLSSVHRAKGLEAENVTILEPKKLCFFGETEESYQQEKNLLYVALTRSKNVLNFCGSLGDDSSPQAWVHRLASRDVAPERVRSFSYERR